jgi:hypothetical protein
LFLQEAHFGILLSKLEFFVENGFTMNSRSYTHNNKHTRKMASLLTVQARNLNAKNVSFVMGPAKANRGPPINLKYGEGDSKQNFQILLPKAAVRLMVRQDEKTGRTDYTLSYPLAGCDPYGRDRADESSETGKLYNFLLDLEESIIQEAITQNGKWFGKKRTDATIRESFNRIIGVSTDKIDGEKVPNGKYPPSLRIKIAIYDGQVSIDKQGIIDEKGKDIYVTPDTLPAVFPNNTQAKLAIVGSAYVINGTSFGISFKLRAAQVFPVSRVNAVSLFMAEEDDAGIESETALGGAGESVPQIVEPEAQRTTSPVDQPTVPVNAAPARKKRTTA